MKTKMKKKCVKILTLIICMVSLVSALVIAPSADTYDENFTHYRFSYEYSHSPDLSSYVSQTDDWFYFLIEAPVEQKAVFNDPSTNTSYTLNFTDLAVGFSLIVRTETSHVVAYLDSLFQLNPHGTDEILLIARTTFVDGVKTQTTYRYRNNDVIFEGTLQENGSAFVIDLWLDVSYVSQVNSRKTDGSVLYAHHYVPLFTDATLVSRPKTYTEGYNDGEDMGMGIGYREGYRVGDIEGYNRGFEYGNTKGYGDGYTIGKQEGFNEGFNTGRGQGYNEGYSAGVTDGYDDGFEDGRIEGGEEGYQNGYDVGYDTGYDDGYLEGKNDQTPVIPSSGDDKDNLNYYWCSVKNVVENFTEKPDSMILQLSFDSPILMRIDFISDRVNGQNIAKTVYCDKLDIQLSQLCSETNIGSYDYHLTRRIDLDLHKEGSNYDQEITITKEAFLNISNSGVITSTEDSYMGINISGFGEGVDHPNWQWVDANGSYFLQMYIDQTRLTGLEYQLTNYWGEVLPPLDLFEFCNMFFTVTKTSVPKTYAEGYNNGVTDGYDDGFEDGWIVGDQEGNIAGYNSGYAVGYTDGETEGYALGYEDGEVYGWQNGFGAGQNDMAETSRTFKEMVFAIFDAPSRLIDSMLNFDIFGINLAGLVKTIITLAVVAVILVILVKWLL